MSDSDAKAAEKTPNRRAFPRRTGKGEVLCRTGKLGMGPQARGKVKDLSPDGASFVVPLDLKIGDELELEFLGAGNKKHVVRATIKKAIASKGKNFEVGCKFDKRLTYDKLAELAR